MTQLSVNINKIATLRNSRGDNLPNLIQTTIDIQKFGANGITVHPRPDERHIKYQDVYDIKPFITTELNIEGRPIKKFIKMVLEIQPNQVTLVPDEEDVLTSNSGWDTILHQSFLTDIINELKYYGIRTSIFLDPNPKLIPSTILTGTDRIELYTKLFAQAYLQKNYKIIELYVETAKEALQSGLSLNAGHDLNSNNISCLIKNIPEISEISVGHALITDALYFGLKNTIELYLKKIKKSYKNL